MAIRQRRIEADYLKVDGTFESMMTQFTSLSEKPGAKESSKRYIGNASSTTTITGYEASADFEGDQICNDKVIEYICDIAKLRKTGGDCETEYCQVELDKPAQAENSFYCRKSIVSIKVDEFSDNDGEFGLKGTLGYKGDPIVGTFNTVTKTFEEGFTAREEATIGILTVVSAAGTETGTTKVTVTPALVGSGNSYKYKLGTNAVTISLGQDCTLLDTWNGTDDITATAGQTITIVEVDTDNKAVKVGSATVTVA